MRIALPTFLLLLATAPAIAQRNLETLQLEFLTQSRKLGESSPSREQRQELLGKQVGELERFLAGEAKGDDRWNGRLMLADLQLARGNRPAAAEALRSISKKDAPALLLVSGAAMAQHLNLRDLRDGWIEAAATKDAPLADRLAMARLLMTVLHEVDKGEAVFTAALAAASDDEQKALVRWHRADGLRDREDLGDNAGFEELEKLANDLPGTYWGSVAKDRLRATRLQAGDPAIPFTAKTRKGDEVSLEGLRGKTVALVFWTAADHDLPRLVTLLGELQQKRGPALAVLGICLDRDGRGIDAAVKSLGISFPVVGEGKGIETDVALRWFVEGPTVHVIDAEGKVAALGLHAGTADARSELTEVLSREPK
jgi:peroxiredoxin